MYTYNSIQQCSFAIDILKLDSNLKIQILMKACTCMYMKHMELHMGNFFICKYYLQIHISEIISKSYSLLFYSLFSSCKCIMMRDKDKILK